MPNISLQAKREYFTKVKRANYKASMRLEGFSVSETDPKTTKEAILAKYRRSKP